MKVAPPIESYPRRRLDRIAAAWNVAPETLVTTVQGGVDQAAPNGYWRRLLVPGRTAGLRARQLARGDNRWLVGFTDDVGGSPRAFAVMVTRDGHLRPTVVSAGSLLPEIRFAPRTGYPEVKLEYVEVFGEAATRSIVSELTRELVRGAGPPIPLEPDGTVVLTDRTGYCVWIDPCADPDALRVARIEGCGLHEHKHR